MAPASSLKSWQGSSRETLSISQAINGREQDLGFTITPTRSSRVSSRYPAVALADLDYADDICLLSDRVREQVHGHQKRKEVECAGLRRNAKMTGVMTYNIHTDHPPIKTSDGNALREANDCKYLGPWINSTEKDLKVRKALAWRALNGVPRAWRSNLPDT